MEDNKVYAVEEGEILEDGELPDLNPISVPDTPNETPRGSPHAQRREVIEVEDGEVEEREVEPMDVDYVSPEEEEMQQEFGHEDEEERPQPDDVYQ
jgi:hypothetical protein